MQYSSGATKSDQPVFSRELEKVDKITKRRSWSVALFFSCFVIMSQMSRYLKMSNYL